MVTSFAHRGITPRIRRVVEEYTPDGTVGRIGLATVTGSIGGFLGWLSAVGVVTGTVLSTLVLTPVATAGFLLCTLVTILVLWPVYLATIGRIESPTEYSHKIRRQFSLSQTEHLKNDYQQGRLSEDDLERELEAVLAESDGSRPKKDRDQLSSADQQVEELGSND